MREMVAGVYYGEYEEYHIQDPKKYLEHLSASRNKPNYMIDLKPTLDKCMETLRKKESRILKEYFYKDKTLTQIGKEMNRSIEIPRMLLARALRNMRHPSRINILEGFLDI